MNPIDLSIWEAIVLSAIGLVTVGVAALLTLKLREDPH